MNKKIKAALITIIMLITISNISKAQYIPEDRYNGIKTIEGSYIDQSNNDKSRVTISKSKKTPDGGIIITGYYVDEIELNNGTIYKNQEKINSGGLLIKYDKYGRIEWSKQLIGDSLSIPTDIRITAEGKYIIAGTTSSSELKLDDKNTITTDHRSNYFIIQYDNKGNIEWHKNYEVPEEISVVFKNQTIITDDQGSILSNCSYDEEAKLENGQTFSKPKGMYDGIIVKYNSEGKIEWANSIKNNKENAAISYKDVIMTTQGEYITYVHVGDEKITYDGNKEYDGTGKYQSLILKYTAEGKLKTIIPEEEKGPNKIQINTIKPTSDGGYIVNKEYQQENDNNAQGTGAIIEKYDQNDNKEWTEKIINPNSQENERNYIENIVQTQDNGYILMFCAESKKELEISDENYTKRIDGSSYILAKLNSQGKFEWLKELEGNSVGIDELIELAENDYMMLAYSLSENSQFILDSDESFENGNNAFKIYNSFIVRFATEEIVAPPTGNTEPIIDQTTEEETNTENQSTTSNSQNNYISVGTNTGNTNSGSGSANQTTQTYKNGYAQLDEEKGKKSGDDEEFVEEYSEIPSESPHTGDTIIYYVAIMITSAIGAITIIKLKKNNKKQTDKKKK